MLITDEELAKTLFGDEGSHLADIRRILADAFGGSTENVMLQPGVWQPAWWLGSPLPEGWSDDYHYGVADSIEQILNEHGELLNDSVRLFVVTVVPVRREDQPEYGGWRYHKWGEYIGTQNPQHEYLYDDKHIDEVLTYSIYEYVGDKED